MNGVGHRAKAWEVAKTGGMQISPFSSNEASEEAADRAVSRLRLAKMRVVEPRDFLELEGELQASRSTSTSLPALHERSEHKRWSGNGYSEGALPESSSGG